MNDLALSPRPANPQALIGLVRAPGGSFRAGIGRARAAPIRFPATNGLGMGPRGNQARCQRAFELGVVHSMTARNGSKFCGLRSYPLLQK